MELAEIVEFARDINDAGEVVDFPEYLSATAESANLPFSHLFDDQESALSCNAVSKTRLELHYTKVGVPVLVPVSVDGRKLMRFSNLQVVHGEGKFVLSEYKIGSNSKSKSKRLDVGKYSFVTKSGSTKGITQKDIPSSEYMGGFVINRSVLSRRVCTNPSEWMAVDFTTEINPIGGVHSSDVSYVLHQSGGERDKDFTIGGQIRVLRLKRFAGLPYLANFAVDFYDNSKARRYSKVIFNWNSVGKLSNYGIIYDNRLCGEGHVYPVSSELLANLAKENKPIELGEITALSLLPKMSLTNRVLNAPESIKSLVSILTKDRIEADDINRVAKLDYLSFVNSE